MNAEVVSGTSDAADSDNTSDDDSDGSTSTCGRSIFFGSSQVAIGSPFGVSGLLPGVPFIGAFVGADGWGLVISDVVRCIASI